MKGPIHHFLLRHLLLLGLIRRLFATLLNLIGVDGHLSLIMNVNNGNILVIYIYFISFKTSLIDNYLACSRDYTVLPTTIVLVLDVVL